MASQKYWEEREQSWIDSQIRKDIEFDKAIANQYEKLELQLYKEAQSFYVNYAKSANITYAEAKKRVSQFDVNEFSNEAAQLVKDKDFSPEANDRLKLYNAKMRINRQMMLGSKMGLETAKISNNVEGMTRDKLEKDIYDEAKRQAGILGNTVPERMDLRVKTLVDSSYLGAKWSDRLWNNNDKLVNDLGNIISQSLIQGMNPSQLANQLRPHLKDSVNNAKYAAQRIARTESTRVSAEYSKRLYKDEGFTKAEWIAEPTACKYCLPRDGKIYDIDDIQIPFHANCRCSFVPYIKDTVFKNITGDDDDSDNELGNNKFISSLSTGARRELESVYNPDFVNEVDKRLNNVPDGLKWLYNNAFENISVGGLSKKKVSYFSPSDEAIYFTKTANYRTVFHEYAHGIDYLTGYKSSTGSLLEDATNDDYDSLVEPFIKDLPGKKAERDLELRKDVRAYFRDKYKVDAGEVFDPNKFGDISDMIRGVSVIKGNKTPIDLDVGHASSYYKIPNIRDKETFAEISSALALNGGSLEIIKQYMPNTYKAYLKIIEEATSFGG